MSRHRPDLTISASFQLATDKSSNVATRLVSLSKIENLAGNAEKAVRRPNLIFLLMPTTEHSEQTHIPTPLLKSSTQGMTRHASVSTCTATIPGFNMCFLMGDRTCSACRNCLESRSLLSSGSLHLQPGVHNKPCNRCLNILNKTARSELLWVEWTATVLFEGLSASCELHFWKPTLKVDAHLEWPHALEKFLQHHI